MSTRNRIGRIVMWGLLATGVASNVASASTSPAERCAASQLKAVGKLASTSLACHAATATTQHPPQPCITAAMTAFAKVWNAAETKGGCVTTASVTDAEVEVGGVVMAAVGELTGTPEDALLTTPAAQACAARKLKATAKDAKADFACDTTGVKHATLFSSTCVEHAGGALLKAWVAAEAKGGCATQGDSEALNINGLSVWGVTHVGPTPLPVSCGTFVTKWPVGESLDVEDSVAVDGSGDVFVAVSQLVTASMEPSRVEKFDNTGTFLLTWGSFGSGPGQFNGTDGVAVDGSGKVFVADGINNRVEKFDNTGTFLLTWGSFGSGPGQFIDTTGVAVDASGNVFVGDNLNDRVEKFDNTGTFLLTWGSTGTGDGQFNLPRGVAVDGSGNVFVTDQLNDRVEKFDNTGTFLLTWGSTGTGDGQFSEPSGVAVDGSGNVFVVDEFNARIQVFDNTGTFLTTWGTPGSGNGQFSRPTGVAVDASGNVLVGDSFNERIQKFACPIPPPPPTVCGVVNGDPAAGTAICGGPCPVDFPFCEWVPGTGSGTGACQCVNGDSPCGGSVTCTVGLCSIQSQTCVRTPGGECACQ